MVVVTLRGVLNVILKALFKLLLRVEIRGMENFPAEGPVVLMINHTSFLDPVLVCGLMPRQVIAMSKIENFSTPIVGTLIKIYGAFPVRRGEVDRRAIRQALEVLERGGVLLMAPEGTRSRDGTLQKGHDGMTFIALRANVPLLPVAVVGSEQFKHNLKRLRRTPITITIGQPFRFRPGKWRVQRDQLNRMTDEAMYQLAALLPPDRRGVYSDLSAATTDFLVFENEVGRVCYPTRQGG